MMSGCSLSWRKQLSSIGVKTCEQTVELRWTFDGLPFYIVRVQDDIRVWERDAQVIDAFQRVLERRAIKAWKLCS